MESLINKYSEDNEYWFHEGCFINELLNQTDNPEISIARVRVISGMTTKWHQLSGITERYVILNGTGIVEVGNSFPRDVRQGDVVTILPGVRQRITNSGSEDLVFLAVCTPRFCETAYNDV